LPCGKLAAGDAVIGLVSSGPHSNGYSLIRRIVERTGLSWDAPAPFEPSRPLGEALLTPTKLYVKPLLAALQAAPGLLALAHVTGGGFFDNLPRVLPDDISVEIGLEAFAPPPVFGWLKAMGGVDDHEMLRTFNCGFGMVAFAKQESEAETLAALASENLEPKLIGRLKPRVEQRVATLGKVAW